MKKLLFLLGLMSLLAFTIETQAQTVWNGTADVSWYNASQTSFNITTPEQLAGVAQLVNNGTTTFNGVTLNLMNDIWLNSTGDSTNNWTPIGGGSPTSQSPEAGNAFQGVFNGHGHAVFNMYCDKTNTFHAGLFCAVKNPSTIDSLVMVNPVVKSRGMMGAIIGFTRSGGGPVYVRNCLVVNARLQGSTGTDDGNIGCIIGASYSNEAGNFIQDCGATGWVSGLYVGGIGGNCMHETITNCYFAGTIEGNNNANAGGISGYSGTRNNCYSYPLALMGNGQGNGTIVSQADLQSDEMITLLGDAFRKDCCFNNGYPVMSYMPGMEPTAEEICTGESVTLRAFGFGSYLWSTGESTDSIVVSPTSTTTYTVTGTAYGTNFSVNSTITVYPQAVITASVAPSADGQVHATLNQYTFTVPCGSSDNITLIVTPDINYRVNQVTLNGVALYDEGSFSEGVTSFQINPGGTLGEIRVYLTNIYTLTTTLLDNMGDTLHYTHLVQPYGTDGLYVMNAGDTLVVDINNTDRWVLTDATIDGISVGTVSSYTFADIHENHTIVATYMDVCGIDTLPFFDGFEYPQGTFPDCYFRNPANPSIPFIGQDPYQGTYSMSALNNIAIGEYAANVPCLILPKLDDQIDVTTLMVQFYGKVTAECHYVVGVMTDPTDMSTFTSVQTIYPTGTTGTYGQYSAYLANYQGTGKYIAIKFPLPAWQYMIIDNLLVDVAPPCSPISDLQASNIFATNATISWNPTVVGTPQQYHVVVKDMTTQTVTTFTTTDTTYLLTNLSEQTTYQVGVYTDCTNNFSSDTVFTSFTTTCLSPVFVELAGDPDDPSSAGVFYMPPSDFSSNYSYSQQWFYADQLGVTPRDFTSIYFHCGSQVSVTRYWNVYVAISDISSTGMMGFEVPTASHPFQLVYSGIVNVSPGPDGWFELELDAPFSYNGHDDYVLAIADNTGSSTTSPGFYIHVDWEGLTGSLVTYGTHGPVDINNPSSFIGMMEGFWWSNDIRFGYCNSTTCLVPNTLTISNVTDNAADVSWYSTDSVATWEVQYHTAADTNWITAATVSVPSYSFTGLNPNTEYSVRIRTICSSTSVSSWSPVETFRTECVNITAIPYFEDFENTLNLYSTNQGTYITCWDRYASSESHYVHIPSNGNAHSGSHFLDFHQTPNCFDIAIMPALDASIDLSTLMSHFYARKTGTTGTLEVGVMTDPADPTTFEALDTIDLSAYATNVYYENVVYFENYGGVGRHIAFRASNADNCSFYIDDVTLQEIPNCVNPANFNMVSCDSSNATLNWTEAGNAVTWNILYGPAGFNPETEGVEVVADTTTFTIGNLASITTYEFYVQSNCGGAQSEWIGPVFATTDLYVMTTTGFNDLTTCGAIICDDGGLFGDLSGGCNSTLVVYPANPGAMMKLTGTCSVIGPPGAPMTFGHLYIYDGEGTSGTELLHVCGTNNQISVISTTGPLTIHFTSGSAGGNYVLTAQCVNCFPPTNVVADTTAANQATLSWSGVTDSYSVYVYGPDTTYYTTTDTFITINNLMPGTAYRAQVRSLCAPDSSDLSSVCYFSTACAPITITATTPWVESFENYPGSGEQPFVCWEPLATDAIYNGPFVYCGHAPSCHSGSNSAEMKGSYNLLVLPAFSNDVMDLRLSFWATATNTNLGVLEVGVVTDMNNPNSFVVLDTCGAPGPRGGSGSGNGNLMGPYDFNTIASGVGRIALRYTNTIASASWNLDDFKVELIPDCPSPVKYSVTASNVGSHTATISFTDNVPTHNSWTVYYKPSSSTAWASVVTNTTSVDLVSLNASTTYDVYVVTNCSTPTSQADATHTIHFTTAVACPAPTNLTVSDVTMSSATISWQGTADSYNITYGTDNTSTMMNFVNLGYLTPGTTYLVSVVSDCGVEGTSTAATVTFTTPLCDVADQCVYTFHMTDSYGDGWNNATITVKQGGLVVANIGLNSGNLGTATVSLCDNQPTTLIWNSGNYDDECSFTIFDAYENVIYASSGTPSDTLTTFTANCTPPSCPPPADITISNIGPASAQVAWTTIGTATNWNLEYKKETDTIWTVVPVTTNSYTLTGLTALTNYNVRIQTNCGNGDVSNYRTTSFMTTLCEMANQCTYTFLLRDNYGDGWTGGHISIVQDGQEVAQLEAVDHNLFNTLTTDTVIVNLCDNMSTSLIWTAGDYPEEASFFLIGPDGTTMYYSSSMYNYTTYTFTTNCSGSGPALCVTPLGLVVGTPTQTDATATWMAGSTETTWNFEYKAASATTWQSSTVHMPSFTMYGLMPNTAYQVRVQAVCDTNLTSDWTEAVTFTTAQEQQTCPAPTNLTATIDATSHTTVTLTWQQEPNTADEWQVNYRQTTESDWSTATATSTTYTLTDLVPNVDYEANVVAHCTNGLTSDPSNTVTWHTDDVGIQGYLERNVNLYPNPATEMIAVEVSDANIMITGVEVYNVYGQLINTIVSTENPLRINVSGLADGMYYVRVTTDNGVVTKNFVKR
ncbi:MAG: fibronectin type III domain-containing protein [Bacteroidales bacterium]|nr:fibronectin type III domain-containing protein [Bacteroidales bacterium]